MLEDVRDVILIFYDCNAIYVEDIEDRSNRPKGCNAMYVKDIKGGKRTYTHIFAHNFLNIQSIFNPQKVLRSWDLKPFNHTIKYILKHVEDVEDRSDTPKGSNTRYVEDVKDRKRTYTHNFAQHHLRHLWHTYHYIAFNALKSV